MHGDRTGGSVVKYDAGHKQQHYNPLYSFLRCPLHIQLLVGCICILCILTVAWPVVTILYLKEMLAMVETPEQQPQRPAGVQIPILEPQWDDTDDDDEPEQPQHEPQQQPPQDITAPRPTPRPTKDPVITEPHARIWVGGGRHPYTAWKSTRGPSYQSDYGAQVKLCLTLIIG